jgi:L-asparaginase
MKSQIGFLASLLASATAAAVDSESLFHRVLLPRQVEADGFDGATPYNSSLQNVTVFGMGGTIASLGGSSTVTAGGLGGGYSVGLGVGQILEAVPEIATVANVRAYQITNEPSGSINQTHLLELSRRVNIELSDPTVAGVVITHGTDTLEETCFFLYLTVQSEKPVVCTAAQRPATAISADGPINVLQSIITASSPNARNRGTLINLSE